MLENIKSSYFIKYIFFCLSDETLLRLVKYSKKWQNKLDINLINYKIFSGKYIIYKSEGQGAIFNALNDHLIYEGGIKDGKKHGKGKEYGKFGNIEYEGEYLNGKRKKIKLYNRFINQYDKEGNLIYHGNEINIEMNGKVKEYDNENRLLFEGEYLQGERNGKGKEYNNIGGLLFEGEYLNGKRWNGKGEEYQFLGGLLFEGEYLNGRRWNGKGDLWNANNIIYEVKEGRGFTKESYDSGEGWDSGYSLLECEIINGEKNGKAKEYYIDDYNNVHYLRFEGEYKNGKKNGKGKEYYENILLFEGEYLYGYIRKGKSYNFNDGRLEFEGEYLYEKLWTGKAFDENGNIKYELLNGKIKE